MYDSEINYQWAMASIATEGRCHLALRQQVAPSKQEAQEAVDRGWAELDSVY